LSGIHEKVCVACQPDAEPANVEEIQQFVSDTEWSLIEKSEVTQLYRRYNFPNFAQALSFTNKVGEIAEEEGHHPEIVTEWGSVTVYWWSHKIKKIHLNDLILAARCDVGYAST
jgi:4a-hydroxytetrahydrobiopterin dehydratase